MAWKTPSIDAAREAAARILPLVKDPRSAASTAAPETDQPGALGGTWDTLAIMAAPMLHRATLVAARRYGAVWAAEEQEAADLARAVVDVIREEMPNLEQEFEGPWMKLALVAGTYALPRLLSLGVGSAAPLEPLARAVVVVEEKSDAASE